MESQESHNPFSTRWDQPFDINHAAEQDLPLCGSLYVLQEILFYEGILIDLDPKLYMPALEQWVLIHPEFKNVLFEMAAIVYDLIERQGRIPQFAIDFLVGIFLKIDIMVNGETINNMDYVNKFR